MSQAAVGQAAVGQAGHDPDVLVVGGGVVGLFCAYFLARGGASVTVVERGPVGGPQSCSHGNTGFVGTQGAAPLAEPGVLAQALRWLTSARSPLKIKPSLSPELAAWLWQFSRRCNESDARACYSVLLELKKRSLDILRGVAACSAELAAAFSEPGMVIAFKTEAGFGKACRSVPRAVDAGVPLRVLTGAELRELEPDARFDISGALFNAEGAAVRTPQFVTALAALAEREGARVAAGTEVTGFEVSAGRVLRVMTSRGDLRPGEVVLAAGAWSARLARPLGVRLAVQPAKGYAITIPAPAGAPKRPVLLSEGKVALLPFGDRLRVGGTLELAGLDTAVSARRIDGIAATVRSCLPGLDLALGPRQEVWTGLRPCTPDSLPLLGRVPGFSNLCVATGHGYIGMGLAPVSGRLIAQVIEGRPPELDLRPLRAGRFGGC